jgi:hypothetical protein
LDEVLCYVVFLLVSQKVEMVDHASGDLSKSDDITLRKVAWIGMNHAVRVRRLYYVVELPGENAFKACRDCHMIHAGSRGNYDSALAILRLVFSRTYRS